MIMPIRAWNGKDRKTLTVYSNRVAVVVEQPVRIKLPAGSYTSAVPTEVYSVASEFKVAS